MPVVQGGHLNKPVIVQSFVEKNGRTYFQCNKLLWPVQALLLGPHDSKTKPLSRTSVIESVTKKRNEMWHKFLADDPREDQALQPLHLDDEDDAQGDDASARKKPKKSSKQASHPTMFR